VYAIIKSGAKQYRVAVGDKIDVEKLPNKVGDKVTLSGVLMVEKDGAVTIGKPAIKGASVLAQVVKEARASKSRISIIATSTAVARRTDIGSNSRGWKFQR
jgi:large subunit ribosomal protein L21